MMMLLLMMMMMNLAVVMRKESVMICCRMLNVQTHHQQCLHDFIEAEAIYYAQCHQYMTDLQKQLGRYVYTWAGI